MCYYDHATATALKLHDKVQEHSLRTFDLEKEICMQRAKKAKTPWLGSLLRKIGHWGGFHSKTAKRAGGSAYARAGCETGT